MNDNNFTITKEWLLKHKTKRGGYTKVQIKSLGLKYPLTKGWQGSLIGRQITREQASNFETGSSIYSPNMTAKYKKIIGGLNHLTLDELKQVRDKSAYLLKRGIE